MKTFSRSLLTFALLLLSTWAVAQPGFDPFFGTQASIKRPGWRKVLNYFTLEASVGYGATPYRTDVSGFSLAVASDSTHILGAMGVDTTMLDTANGLISWFPNAVVGGRLDTFPFYFNGDTTAPMLYRGTSHSLPLKLRLYFSYDRFRIGGGIHYEWQRIQPMSNTLFPELAPHQPLLERTTFRRWFIMAGARVYTWRYMSYVVDVEVGRVTMTPGFAGHPDRQRLYFNVGVPIEYNFSEYLRVYARPNVEFKSVQTSLPAGLGLPVNSLTHQQNAFSVNFGISYTFPELRRCPIKQCEVQMKHTHQGYEFRGQPINKIQNPGYGENHRRLEKHRWRYRNKRGEG